eukprot:1140066-Pelagomonas_calceolata.AAC.4
MKLQEASFLLPSIDSKGAQGTMKQNGMRSMAISLIEWQGLHLTASSRPTTICHAPCSPALSKENKRQATQTKLTTYMEEFQQHKRCNPTNPPVLQVVSPCVRLHCLMQLQNSVQLAEKGGNKRKLINPQGAIPS